MTGLRGIVLTIDPGLTGTGFSLWDDFEGKDLEPRTSGIIRSSSAKTWTDKATVVTQKFIQLLLNERERFKGENPMEHPEITVVIEFPELYTSSVSHAAGVKGDLFKLAYLAGRLTEATRSVYGSGGTTVILINPSTWKGQLTKVAVQEWIKRITGRKASYRDHEADAIGMALFLKGRFQP